MYTNLRTDDVRLSICGIITICCVTLPSALTGGADPAFAAGASRVRSSAGADLKKAAAGVGTSRNLDLGAAMADSVVQE
jgi:hypothetical protein